MNPTQRQVPLVLVLASCIALGVAHAKPPLRAYTVQPGDSLWSIAAELYGNGARYGVIVQHNPTLGKAPRVLEPGTVLMVPEGDVKPAAEIAWRAGDVRVKPPRSLDWLDADQGTTLWKDYLVEAPAEASLALGFEDGARVSLAGPGAFTVLAPPRPRVGGKTPPPPTALALTSGVVRVRAAAAPVTITTPGAQLEVAGKDALIAVVEGQTTVSAIDGAATVKARGAVVPVAAGQGTIVRKDQPAEPARALLPAPTWGGAGDAAGGGRIVAVAPPEGRGQVSLAWQAVPGAASYRVELAADDAFERVVMTLVVPATEVSLAVPIGDWRARVAARDGATIVGRASAVTTVEVIPLISSRRMSLGPDGWEVVAFTRLDLAPRLNEVTDGTPSAAVEDAHERAAGLAWSIDDGPFVRGTEPLRVLGPGAHTIAVRVGADGAATHLSFRVLAVHAIMDLGGVERFAAGTTEARTLTLSITDERGRPAIVPGIVIEASPGGKLATEPVGPGVVRALLPSPAAPGPREILVRASWTDGLLVRGRIEVERQLLEPYVYRWREAVEGLTWDDRRAPTELPSLEPIDRLGIEIGALRADDATTTSLRLRGEWALGGPDERAVGTLPRPELGLDASLSFFRLGLAGDVSEGHELGDLTVGARWIGYRDRRVALAASLRARAPLGAGPALWGVEPSALLRWRALERLWIDTRQGVFAALGPTDEGGDASYIGDYALVWMPFGARGAFGLAAQLGMALSLGDAPLALSAGGSAFVHLGRVRLGFELGTGFGDGADRYGEITGAVTVDFGLGLP